MFNTTGNSDNPLGRQKHLLH